ncbi:MAG TPA: NAD(P)H-binding protein [Lactobacillaceae bacterium]|jgi:nucleoside-diphosphate-sugar epimerase
MKIFVTGGSGGIGSAVVPNLLAHGHEVVALARSTASEAKLADLGAQVVRGELGDLSTLREQAQLADAVVHLAFVHNWADMSQSGPIDRAAIQAMADVMLNTDKPLVITAGIEPRDTFYTENDVPDTQSMRGASEALMRDLTARGLHGVIVRPAPTVHFQGDLGFVKTIADVFRENGEAFYVGDGANRWSAVQLQDIGDLYRLAVEKAPAGAQLHGVGETEIPFKDIAAKLAECYELPLVNVASDVAVERLHGFIGHVAAANMAATNDQTKALVGWEPTHNTLFEDIDAGYYD